MKNKISTEFDEHSDIAVAVSQLSKNYHKTTALQELSLELHSGQIIGLIGANGSGKTTLFQILSGILPATSGSFSVLGGNPLTDIRVKNELIYSLYDLPLEKSERLKNVLSYYQIMYPKFDQEFANKMMKLFDLPEKKKISSLSQGMKSIFHFLCAVAARCQVTMLDEPFIGIDIEKRKLAYEILLRDYMEYPRTFIISSHNLAELEHLLSEMVLIHQGRVIFYEDIDTVRDMLIRVEGEPSVLQQYTANQTILHTYQSELGSFVIAQGGSSSPAATEAARLGLEVTPVSPEDVCVYLTTNRKEETLSCLWN